LNIASGAVYDMNGHNEVLEVIEGSGSIINTGALSMGFSGSSAAFAGTIAGSGSLLKAGGGTQTLSGTLSYTGGTTLNGGRLVVNRLHENNAVSISGGVLQVADSSPTLPSTPSGNNAFVSRPSSLSIANNGAPLGTRL
jgi:fibronectin-binding autotransporter adhesin